VDRIDRLIRRRHSIAHHQPPGLHAWRARSTQGLSRWLFIGQLAASTGFVFYSWLPGSWVFVVTNVLMLATAGIGQWIYLRNKRREERAAAVCP
jgi:MtN3 and saliva related transmembrane protein